MENPFFSDNFTLEDLTYIPVGECVPVFNRPYTVNVNGNTVSAIQDRLAESRGCKITPNVINGLANSVIQHSAIGYKSLVDKEWIDTPKYIFMLKVSTVDQIGLTNCTYIQGYTNHNGIGFNGSVDNEMVHTINNVIETNVIPYNTPFGPCRREKLSKMYNVFSNSSEEMIFTQRPSDVFSNIDNMNMFSVMNDSELNLTNNLYTINPFDRRVVGSSTENNISTEYLSKILNAGMLLNNEKTVHVSSFAIDNVDTPSSRLIEPGFSDNRFFKHISRLAGYTSTINKFQFKTIGSMDPSIYDRFKLLNITKDFADPNIANTPNVGEFWTGTDPVTREAYSIIEASVAMAVKYGFNKLYFTATNMNNPTCQAEIFITNFNSFINLEELEFFKLLEIFKTNFINEVFLNETNNNQLPMHIEMYVDLLGTSKVNITFAGYNSNWYTIPTYANSSFSPVVTVNKEAFDDLAMQLHGVINELTAPEMNQQQRTYY